MIGMRLVDPVTIKAGSKVELWRADGQAGGAGVITEDKRRVGTVHRFSVNVLQPGAFTPREIAALIVNWQLAGLCKRDDQSGAARPAHGIQLDEGWLRP